MANTNFNYDAANIAYSNLQAYAPQENELNNTFTITQSELESLSAKHDNFLSGQLSELGAGGTLYDSYSKNNEEYNSLLNSLATAISEYSAADSGGGVSGYSGGGSGGSSGYAGDTTVGASDTTTTTDTSSVTQGMQEATGEMTSTLDELNGELKTTTNTDNKLDTSGYNLDPTQPRVDDSLVHTVEDGMLTPNTSGASSVVGAATGAATSSLGATAVGSGIAAGAAALETKLVETGGLGDNTEGLVSNNAFGDHKTSKETYESLSSDEQAQTEAKLKELGFSDAEIAAIKAGDATAPKLAVDAVAEQLEATYKSNPEIRQEFIDKYGFDPFNADGTVDKDKLALALVMDRKNGTDDYSIITTLHSKYGVDIVDQNTYATLQNRLETTLSKNSGLRDKIKEKYGFDVFNEDGTINRDNLSLAMLMDNKSTTDEYDLTKLLDDNYKEQVTKSIVGNVSNPLKSNSSVKQSGMGAAPIIAGLGVLGAAGSGLAVAKHNKDKKENKYIDDDLDDITDTDDTDIDNDLDNDKDWLYGEVTGLDDKTSIDSSIIEEKKGLI